MSTTLDKPAPPDARTAAPMAPERASGASFAPVYRRILRRETHSPRSLVAIVLAVLLIVALAWVATEIVIALLGGPALLVAPVDMVTATVGLADAPAAIVAAAGIAVAVIGLVLVLIALSPGRRARHVLASDRTAVVVDDEVIASALARHASVAGNVDPDNASVSVSHRRAVVHLTPTSGIPVDRDEVTAETERRLAGYGLSPAVSARVRISESGRVGA
jgi:hypothetical protein